MPSATRSRAPRGGALEALVERLRTFKASGHHEFWPDAVSINEATTFTPGAIRGYRQLTDAYLLGLAHANHGRLVTFDRSISSSIVPKLPPGTLEILQALDD